MKELMRTLFPEQPFEFACAQSPEVAAQALQRALAQRPENIFARWRVRGAADAERLVLFYSWKRASNPLAPHLYARWSRDSQGVTRLMGVFRQRQPIAAIVMAGCVVMSGMLAVMWQRHDMPGAFAAAGIVMLLAYPRFSWLMTTDHTVKIREFLETHLSAAGAR